MRIKHLAILNEPEVQAGFSSAYPTLFRIIQKFLQNICLKDECRISFWDRGFRIFLPQGLAVYRKEGAF
jgi:hypothetical protein